MIPVSSHLSTNTVLELLVLVYMLINTIGYLAPGVLKDQFSQVVKTRGVRIFVPTYSKHYVLRALLVVQFFLFLGLHCFLLAANDPAEQLERATDEDWHLLLCCIAVPVGWSLLQFLLVNWWGSILGSRVKILTMNRVFFAIHIVLSPLVMTSFLLEMIGLVEVETASILLSLIFIFGQILFIYSGIKIFWGGWSTVFFLILYLCTLEIAPLVMICQLLTR